MIDMFYSVFADRRQPQYVYNVWQRRYQPSSTIVYIVGGAYSLVACLSHLTIDHASLSRRSTVPTPNRSTSNIWALITLLP